MSLLHCGSMALPSLLVLYLSIQSRFIPLALALSHISAEHAAPCHILRLDYAFSQSGQQSLWQESSGWCAERMTCSFGFTTTTLWTKSKRSKHTLITSGALSPRDRPTLQRPELAAICSACPFEEPLVASVLLDPRLRDDGASTFVKAGVPWPPFYYKPGFAF